MLILPIAFVASWILTGLMCRYALRWGMLDQPNHRSSHNVSTPRGGGISFVCVFLGTMLYLLVRRGGDYPLALALLGSGALVAAVGFIDDKRHVPARFRLVAHALAAGWTLAILPVSSITETFGQAINVGPFIYLLWAFLIVWMVNLYNFMDGIDGIASIEAITAYAGTAFLALLAGQPELAWVLGLGGAAVAGFIIWNLPPAKIFMGDAGSGFLGVISAVLLVHSSSTHLGLFWAMLVLFGVFIVDATFTLMRRLFNGERVYEAHRSHAYQIASRRLGGHRPVILGVLAINGFWLFPLAWLCVAGLVPGMIAVVLAYTPLIALVGYVGAGNSLNQ